jgi:hypothetical protein
VREKAGKSGRAAESMLRAGFEKSRKGKRLNDE